MKLTHDILWNDHFINKFTNLRTSFLIFLARILIDTKRRYHWLYDSSWLKVKICADCNELFKNTNTNISDDSITVYNYYPSIVKFGKRKTLSHKFNKNDSEYTDEKIKFEDGIKYILNQLFTDLKYNDTIELFRIKIKDFINKDNEKYKNELIEKMFKYLSNRFEFPSSVEYRVQDEPFYIDCVYKIFTDELGHEPTSQNLYFTISFNVYTEGNDKPITFINDSQSNFEDFYKKIKKEAKLFIENQKNISCIQREMNKYL